MSDAGGASGPSIARVRALLAEGQVDEGMEMALGMARRRPGWPRLRALLSLCFLRAGDPIAASEEIEIAFALAEEQEAEIPPAWAELRFEIAEGLGTPEAMAEALAGLSGRTPTIAILRRAIKAALAAGRGEDARRLSMGLVDRTKLQGDMGLRLRTLTEGVGPEAIGPLLAAEAARVGPGSLGLHVLRMAILQVAGGRAGRAALCAPALDAWPEGRERDLAQLRALGRLLPNHPDLEPLPPAGGRLAPADRAIEEHRGENGTGDDEAFGVFRSEVAEHLLTRPILEDDPDREVLVSERAPSDTAVLVFTGLGDRPGLPVPVLDAYLSALGQTAVLLRDERRLLHAAGVASLAPDLEGTVAALRDLLAGLGIKRVWTLGHSTGGFAALLYASLLGAERALAFNPFVSLEPDPNDMRLPFLQRRVQAALDPSRRDLPAALAGVRPRPRFEVVYGAAGTQDAAQARRLAGLATLLPLQGFASHTAVVETLRRGELGRLLEGDLSGLMPAVGAAAGSPAP
jgi:hypothetical protein